MATSPALMAAAKKIHPAPLPAGYIPRGQVPNKINVAPGWKPGDAWDPVTQLERFARVDYGPRNNHITYADVLFDLGDGRYLCLLCWTPIAKGEGFTYSAIDHFKHKHPFELTLHHQQMRHCGYFDKSFGSAFAAVAGAAMGGAAGGGATSAAAAAGGAGDAAATASVPSNSAAYGGFGTLTRLLAACVSLGPFPYRFVCNGATRMLIRGLNGSTEVIPGRKAVASACVDLGEEKKVETRKMFGAVRETYRINVTADGWTSRGKHSYVISTAHWLDDNYNLCSCVAGCAHIKGKHDAPAVRKTILKSMGDNLGIGKDRIDMVTTDNGANYVKAFEQDENITAQSCAAHTAMLVEKKMETVPWFDKVLTSSGAIYNIFAHSTGRIEKLEDSQRAEGKEPKRPVNYSETRWHGGTVQLTRNM